MKSKNISILEFPTNLGLKKKENDSEPGVKHLPDWLRSHGFHEQLSPNQVRSLDPHPIPWNWMTRPVYETRT